MSKTKLHVGTSLANLQYHAVHATPPDVEYSRKAISLCGQTVKVGPLAWDDARQERQDSCILCVKRVRLVLDRIERDRAVRARIVAGYIRASTDRQVESPEIQADIITGYCDRHNLGPPTFYVDEATHGWTPIAGRTAGGRMLRDLRRGDHLVVARVDRMARSFLDFAQTIDVASKRGITLHFVDFPLGAIGPEDELAKMFLQLLAIFAAYERKIIVSRIKEACEYRRKLGRRVGAEPRFGFRHETRADGKVYEVVDDYEASICEKALELTIKGYTRWQVATFFNEEWKIKNPRSRVKNVLRKDDANFGKFFDTQIAKMLDRAIEIGKLRGTLPPGIETRKDLMNA